MTSVLWIAVLSFGAYLLYGLSVRSPFQRRFPSELPADRTIDGYLEPQEVVDPDEDELSRRAGAAFAADTRRLRENAGRDDPAFHEPHWGHTTGLVRGTLDIDAVDALPERFRVGLFAKDASYPAVARVGTVKDPDLRFAVNRFALKLEYPEPVPNVYAESGKANELDLLLIEGESGENGVGRTFFLRDGRQIDMAITLKPPSLGALRTFANWRNVRMFLGVLRKISAHMKALRRAPANVSGWAGKPYYSAGPFALGEGMMKFALRPRQAHEMPEIDVMKGDPTVPHKEAMEAWFANGEDAEFDLCVQLATPESIPDPKAGDPPKSVMAAEYCDLHWDESASPFVVVGHLTLRADDALSRQFAWSPLQFNAWNTLPEMRPLGQTFRVRKHVHAVHSNTRVAHLYGETPGAMTGRCPFAR